VYTLKEMRMIQKIQEQEFQTKKEGDVKVVVRKEAWSQNSAPVVD
jgi:hypothetical protein